MKFDHKHAGTVLIALSAVLGALDLAQFGIDIPMDVITAIVFFAGTVLLAI